MSRSTKVLPVMLVGDMHIFRRTHLGKGTLCGMTPAHKFAQDGFTRLYDSLHLERATFHLNKVTCDACILLYFTEKSES